VLRPAPPPITTLQERVAGVFVAMGWRYRNLLRLSPDDGVAPGGWIVPGGR